MNRHPWLGLAIGLLLIPLASSHALGRDMELSDLTTAVGKTPASWRILPIPRDADYGSPEECITLGRVAIVRRPGSPYQTRRDDANELVGGSILVEEELSEILRQAGAIAVHSVADDLPSYDDYDTLILLGSPQHNQQTARYFKEEKLSFENWDDPNTPEDDFATWSDFGREGYLLKVGRSGDKNIVILAGYDFDDAKNTFHGAGTFYAMQSLRQLLIHENGTLKLKTAEIADKPLVAYRACMTGKNEEQNWRNVRFMAQIKANQNNYWYGHSVVGYSAEAASKFRYPWRPQQLEFFGEIGKYCREHFVTMVFCLNPDHYKVDWAAPKTFDGSKKDPLHYDPNYRAESEFRELWSKLGYEVNSDIDILAAKFAQMNAAVGGGAMLTMMNEDDPHYGLVHESDIRLFQTDTTDPKKNATNYGRARALLLTRLYRRIRKIAPDSSSFLPVCPPGQMVYQLILDRDEAESREFLASLAATLKENGLLEKMPLITTGGATAAEVLTNKALDDFRSWSHESLVSLHDNNFAASFRVGAYETDPDGRRAVLQVNEDLPSGYRDRFLYKRLWGIVWNGISDQHVHGWTYSQFMWNMLALNRDKVNALAVRKVCRDASYPLVKSFYEEWDNPSSYLPDNHGPFRFKYISDRIAFPNQGWNYTIRYTDAQRQECQRLIDKLDLLLPQLESHWESAFGKPAAVNVLAHNAYGFCSVYLAYGYINGWENDTADNKWTGPALRDLFLKANDLQQRFFLGPVDIPGEVSILHSSYFGDQFLIYSDGKPFAVPKTVEEAAVFFDIWKEGLLKQFFEPVVSIPPVDFVDEDERLAAGWSEIEEVAGKTFRIVDREAVLKFASVLSGRLLIRAKIGTGAVALTESTSIRLSLPEARHEDGVCKPRWIHWLLPEGVGISNLTIQSDKPVRVYTVEVYRCVEENETD